MSDDKPKCAGDSFHPGPGGGWLPCEKGGIHYEDDKHWCGVHAPSAVKRRRNRERAGDEAKRRQRERVYAKEAAEREVVAAAVEWRLAWRGGTADGIQLGAVDARLGATVDALLKLREGAQMGGRYDDGDWLGTDDDWRAIPPGEDKTMATDDDPMMTVALQATAALMRVADQLDEWAAASIDGGWSRHQVELMRRLAHEIRDHCRVGSPERILPGKD